MLPMNYTNVPKSPVTGTESRLYHFRLGSDWGGLESLPRNKWLQVGWALLLALSRVPHRPWDSLSTIWGIWSCPFSLKPSALQPLGHPSHPGPDLFGSFLHWGVQELVALYFYEARFFLPLSSYRFHLVSEMAFGCGTFRVTAQLSDWLVNESVGCVGL